MGGEGHCLFLAPPLPGILSRQPFWFLGSFEGSGFRIHHSPAAVLAGDLPTPLQAPTPGKQLQGTAESSGERAQVLRAQVGVDAEAGRGFLSPGARDHLTGQPLREVTPLPASSGQVPCSCIVYRPSHEDSPDRLEDHLASCEQDSVVLGLWKPSELAP